jgi:hypothetical protein
VLQVREPVEEHHEVAAAQRRRLVAVIGPDSRRPVDSDASDRTVSFEMRVG